MYVFFVFNNAIAGDESVQSESPMAKVERSLRTFDVDIAQIATTRSNFRPYEGGADKENIRKFIAALYVRAYQSPSVIEDLKTIDAACVQAKNDKDTTFSEHLGIIARLYYRYACKAGRITANFDIKKYLFPSNITFGNIKDEDIDRIDITPYTQYHVSKQQYNSDIVLSTDRYSENYLEESITIVMDQSTTLAAAADEYFTGGDNIVALLNFANAVSPGGAQEGSLTDALTSDKKGYRDLLTGTSNTVPKANGQYIPENGVVITGPLREKTEVMGKKKYYAIASAAFDIGSRKPAEYEQKTKEKIKAQLRAVRRTGVVTFITGAWGCGVFQNNLVDIANFYADIFIQEYEALKGLRIVFAIPPDQKGTFEAFKKTLFQRLNSGNGFSFEDKTLGSSS
jgi:hypothetical protein